MTIWVPGWMQGGTYTAQQDRINSRAADWDEGVLSRVDLKVSQRGAGANLSVDVATGGCIVTGDDQANQGNYDVFNDAVFNLTGFVATSANTRYDIVVMQINDPNAGGAAGSNAVITRVAGTQASSPVIPAIPASALLLAIVGPFTTSTSSITNSMIHDAYTGTGPAGVTGARLCRGFRDIPGTPKQSLNAVAPNGWLVGDGSAISRATYARLFEHIGITFGAGDGSTTFNLPDYRGRAHFTLDNQGGSDAGRLAAANALGGTGGEELHTLSGTEMPVHLHSVDPPSTAVSITDPGHHHSTQARQSAGVGVASGAFATVPAFAADVTGDSTTGITATVDITSFNTSNSGSGAAHNNMPPYILGYTHIRT